MDEGGSRHCHQQSSSLLAEISSPYLPADLLHVKFNPFPARGSSHNFTNFEKHFPVDSSRNTQHNDHSNSSK